MVPWTHCSNLCYSNRWWELSNMHEGWFWRLYVTSTLHWRLYHICWLYLSHLQWLRPLTMWEMTMIMRLVMSLYYFSKITLCQLFQLFTSENLSERKVSLSASRLPHLLNAVAHWGIYRKQQSWNWKSIISTSLHSDISWHLSSWMAENMYGAFPVRVLMLLLCEWKKHWWNVMQNFEITPYRALQC